MSKGALYEFNNPDQLKIPLPHKHIASTFNDIMSKDVGYAYVSLLYACPGNDSNLLIVFYVQIMPDDFVM
ncbi:hypothetical protein ACSSKA_05045, partial [Escherichia coli]|uniref:hypothetical protein n=1 Tax=Escherichia coli TaxID=562 RepID=UPI003FD27BE4